MLALIKKKIHSSQCEHYSDRHFSSCTTKKSVNKMFSANRNAIMSLFYWFLRFCSPLSERLRGCLFFPISQRPFLHSHNSKTCYNPILVGEYLALLSQQYGIWVILLNMNGPFTELNGVAWQWPFFPSLLHAQNNIQRSSLGTFPRNQQKRNSKLSLKPSKH